MNILQRIFTDHYEKIKYTLHPRSSAMENIDKMINCGDPSFGGAIYRCPICGNKYAMERTATMSFNLVNIKHRHCVFTIEEDLRDFFLKDCSLLDCLFHAVRSVLSTMFFKLHKSMNFTPGFIMILHTFGRDLKWNLHIHGLIAEDGYSDNGFWRNVQHFNYNFLRHAFRTALLNEIKKRIEPSFKPVKARCYRQHKHGFYVYAKPNQCDPKTVLKYVGRYLGRPVIAKSNLHCTKNLLNKTIHFPQVLPL